MKRNLGFRDRTNPLFFDKEENMRLEYTFRIFYILFVCLLIVLIGLGRFNYTNSGMAFVSAAVIALAVATLPLERAKLAVKIKTSNTPMIDTLYDDERAGIGRETIDNKWTLD